jgi:NAD(P)-dependent dehydrogenase (short-subunit alcohol dehydrogenase family)
MVGRGARGSIVNISSGASTSARAGAAHYCGSKAAVNMLTEVLAIELGPHGIRVVTLASGGVPETLPEGFEGREEIVEMIEAQTLLGRAATLEDIGNAAVFAASDWARSVTAAIVNVSCGALID